MKRVAFLILISLATSCPVFGAKTIDLDSATIADINAAFKAGTLTAEGLVQLCLARIRSYDRDGPSLHAVITLNPKAIETARELDAERKAKGPRSALHGIPVVLKDNYNTADLPTTGGSVLLEGSIPPADAFVVKKLRDAGAIILAKMNMSEFASPPSQSSLGGQSLTPHDLRRSPAGSSGGTGVAVAAAYAPLGLGTDTGGSIRGPSTANGIVGLKPTHGLLSRSGIIPLSLTFDTGGPMARSVNDVAVALSAMTGIDPADAATQKSEGKFSTDYTKDLRVDALKGARIGMARDFLGADPDCRLGDRGVARRHAQFRCDDRRCPVSEMAARFEARVLQRHSHAGICRTDQRLSRHDRTGISQDNSRNDRPDQSLHRSASGWRSPQSRSLDLVQA